MKRSEALAAIQAEITILKTLEVHIEHLNNAVGLSQRTMTDIAEKIKERYQQIDNAIKIISEPPTLSDLTSDKEEGR